LRPVLFLPSGALKLDRHLSKDIDIHIGLDGICGNSTSVSMTKIKIRAHRESNSVLAQLQDSSWQSLPTESMIFASPAPMDWDESNIREQIYRILLQAMGEIFNIDSPNNSMCVAARCAQGSYPLLEYSTAVDFPSAI
jgi:hypothetical protein